MKIKILLLLFISFLQLFSKEITFSIDSINIFKNLSKDSIFLNANIDIDIQISENINKTLGTLSVTQEKQVTLTSNKNEIENWITDYTNYNFSNMGFTLSQKAKYKVILKVNRFSLNADRIYQADLWIDCQFFKDEKIIIKKIYPGYGFGGKNLANNISEIKRAANLAYLDFFKMLQIDIKTALTNDTIINDKPMQLKDISTYISSFIDTAELKIENIVLETEFSNRLKFIPIVNKNLNTVYSFHRSTLSSETRHIHQKRFKYTNDSSGKIALLGVIDEKGNVVHLSFLKFKTIDPRFNKEFYDTILNFKFKNTVKKPGAFIVLRDYKKTRSKAIGITIGVVSAISLMVGTLIYVLSIGNSTDANYDMSY